MQDRLFSLWTKKVEIFDVPLGIGLAVSNLVLELIKRSHEALSSRQ